MGELRFDGRTAIVTGAGGNPSIGRAYAMLLASRGANVVVNDIGRDPEATYYTDSASAAAVVDEIRALGGTAVADTNSVATEEGAAALVKTALDAFGKVDILINNAGMVKHGSFEEVGPWDFHKLIATNLMGHVLTCHAVWPLMRAQGYGRILNTTSAALTGYARLSPYSATKGGVFSLTRSLAAEGASLGIKVNAINPGAFSRQVAAGRDPSDPVYQNAKNNYPAELCAPVAAFLVHEDCPVTGECIEAVGGKVHRVFLAQTNGFTDRDLTIEKVADRWAEVMDDRGATIMSHGALAR